MGRRDGSPALELTEREMRAELVRAAITAFRSLTFHEVTLERIAARTGHDLRTVLAHFPTMDDLVVATSEAWNAQRLDPVLVVARERGAVAFLRVIIRANAADPALIRFMFAAANIAGTPEHPNAPDLRQQWLRFHALVQRTLMHDVAVGREPASLDPARGAEQLIALYEGLELQSMVHQYMDVIDAYDQAVAGLRHGWSASVPPVWQI